MFLLAAPLLAAAPSSRSKATPNQASAPAQTPIWKQNAVQLSRAWRGKTREQLLYQLPIVSSKDRIVRAEGKKFYALVEYYKDQQFRKFLFQGPDPQTFITAAASAADVLAVNKKYGINIGLKQDVFEQSYPGASAETNTNLPAGSTLYHLSYTDVNTPKPQDHWFLFEQGTLSQTFYTLPEKNNYLNSLLPKETPQVPAETTPAPTPVRKALISGGTEWDKANLPRVVNYKPAFQTPTLTQEK